MATLCAALVSCLAATLTPLDGSPVQAAEQVCTISAKLVNSCRPWLGAESGGYGVTGFKDRMLEHEARIGRRLDVVHHYLGPGEVLNGDLVALAKRPKTIALVNWRVADRWADAAGGNKVVNAQIDAMADSIKALGTRRIMLAVFHEPENDISPGGDANCPDLSYKGSSGPVADYPRMWHNVRARFDAKGVSNVVWVMNYMGWKGWNCVVKDLWPGNGYVDWVTWDPVPRIATWTTAVSSFYDFLTAHNDAAHNFLSKPWGLSEFAYVGSSQTAAYAMYDEARRDLQNNVFPKLKMYVVWDQFTPLSHDDRVGYAETGVKDPTEQARYNAFANDSRLKGDAVMDLTPPTAPTGLRAAPGPTSVALSWKPSSDDAGVASYYLFRNNLKYRSLGNVTSYVDTGLKSNTTYTYKVYAIDVAGHWSASSAPVSATTDDIPPTAPTGLTAVPGAGQVALSWKPSTDNIGVAKYYLFRNNAKYKLLGNVTGYTNTGLTANTTYTYKVYAIDAAGNWSASSATVSATAR